MIGRIIIAASVMFGALAGLADPLKAEAEQNLVPAQIAGIPFGKYVQSPGYLRSLNVTVTEFEKKFGECEAATYDARMQIGQPQVPVKFPDQKDTAPQWIEVVRVEGCSAPYIRGVFVALLKGKVSFFPLLKGNGISGIFLQKQVISKILSREKAAAQKAGCVKDSQVRILQHDMVDKEKKVPTGAWDEVWKVKNCKGPKYVQVTFKVDEKGTAAFTLQDVEVK